MSSQDDPEVILMPRFTGTPTALRIRRVDRDANGVPVLGSGFGV